MSLAWVIALAVACSCSSLLPGANGEIENYAELWQLTMESMTSPPETVTAQSRACQGIQFEDDICTLEPRDPATSVHLLTPADIGIVAAIGDSMTAAFGAKSTGFLDSPFEEYRGVSWSIGGDGNSYTDCATIPNILKEFNPNVYGASTGRGDENSKGSNLNRAVSGAESKDIYEQAVELVGMIEALSPEMQGQWKLITLWIGGNDLCRYCGKKAVTPEVYVQNIQNTISYLRGKLTKTLVSVAQVLDITKVTSTTGIVCGVVHWYACDCASKSETSQRCSDYAQKLEDYVESIPMDDNFGVVLQPFFKNSEMPMKNGKVDMSFFAPDCFHMSVVGHRALAAALWNNMVSEDKETQWVPYSPVLKCPDPAQPYFYTPYTRAKLDAQTQDRQGYNSQTLPKREETGKEGSSDDRWSVGQISAVVVGSVVTALVLVGVAIVVAILVRRRRRNINSEAVPLVNQQ